MQALERPLLVSQAKARQMIGIGTTKFWELVKSGKIKTITLHEGGRPMVVYASLEALVNGDKP
jgi:hypothetical protein